MICLRVWLPVLAAVCVAGCSNVQEKTNKPTTYAAGEKASVGPLTYSIIDTQILPQLGDPSNPRNPQTRFFLVRVSVSNSSNADVAIPAMTLIDDSGKAYPELVDGSGVAEWLGLIRKAGSGQTEQGHVVFDAPAQHYRLRLTDPNDDSDIGVDIPLDFVHEQMRETGTLPAPGDATTAQPELAPGRR